MKILLGLLVAVAAVSGCKRFVPPSEIPDPPPTETPKDDPRWAEYEAKMAALDAKAQENVSAVDNAVAIARAAHEESKKPGPSIIKELAGAVGGQPAGQIAGEVSGALALLMWWLTKGKRKGAPAPGKE